MAKLGGENDVFEVELKIDTTEAVNSLKKLQRVARETVRDLKEVELFSGLKFDKEKHLKKALALLPDEMDKEAGSMVHKILKAIIYSCYEDDLKPSIDYPFNDIESFTTKALTDELIKRSSVEEIIIDPYGKVRMSIENIDKGGTKTIDGPAILLINKD